MKTKFILSSFIFSLLILVSSCTDSINDLVYENETIDLSDMKIDLGKMDCDEPVILYNYKKDGVEDFSKLAENIDNLISEAQEEINLNPEITAINLLISKNSEAIYLDSYVLLNDETESIIGIKHFGKDYETKNHSERFDYLDLSVKASPCPEGWTNLGKCSNTSKKKELENCIGGLLGEYYAENINKVGDCAKTMVKVRLLSTIVCGKKCD